MKKIKIGIIGPTGKMGSSIIHESLSFPNLSVNALCEKKNHPMIGKVIQGVEITDDLFECINKSDVIIDFSSPIATLNVMRNLKGTTGLVVGTTGFTRSQELDFKKLSKGLKILRSSNMSFGVNLALNITSLIAAKLPEEANIEILDIHHNQKVDSPSGTALSFGDEIRNVNKQRNTKTEFVYRGFDTKKKRKKSEIGFSSIRGGDVVGEHTVFFMLEGERIELKHKATNRNIFSRGSLLAAEWLFKKKQGLYSIKDIMRL